MIIHVQITMQPKRRDEVSDFVRRGAMVEIEPEFLPCLNIREIASKLAVGAFKEYLAKHPPEADEQEEGE